MLVMAQRTAVDGQNGTAEGGEYGGGKQWMIRMVHQIAQDGAEGIEERSRWWGWHRGQ